MCKEAQEYKNLGLSLEKYLPVLLQRLIFQEKSYNGPPNQDSFNVLENFGGNEDESKCKDFIYVCFLVICRGPSRSTRTQEKNYIVSRLSVWTVHVTVRVQYSGRWQEIQDQFYRAYFSECVKTDGISDTASCGNAYRCLSKDNIDDLNHFVNQGMSFEVQILMYMYIRNGFMKPSPALLTVWSTSEILWCKTPIT